MQKLVCDICGGAIVVQSGGKYGVCDCCGANYTIDRMREITSGIKVSQTGTSDDVEQWKALLNTYLSAFDWSAAESTVRKILEAVPSDEYALDIYQKLQKWKDYVIKDGVMLEYKGIDEHLVIPEGVKKLDFIIHPDHHDSNFQKKYSIEISDGVTDIVRINFSSFYKEVFVSNTVRSIDSNCFCCWFESKFSLERKLESGEFAKIYLPERFRSQRFRAGREEYGKQESIYYDTDDFIYYKENETIDEVKARVAKEEEEAQKEFEKNQRDFRIYEGVCQHCGGDFKGIFNKVCSVCGKPKDY